MTKNKIKGMSLELILVLSLFAAFFVAPVGQMIEYTFHFGIGLLFGTASHYKFSTQSTQLDLLNTNMLNW